MSINHQFRSSNQRLKRIVSSCFVIGVSEPQIQKGQNSRDKQTLKPMSLHCLFFAVE